MITRLYVRNYRSIGEIELELGSLTALAGPNGSGKSNVADVLRFLSDCVNTSLGHAVAARQGFTALRRWNEGQPFDVEIAVEVRTGADGGIRALTLTSSDEEDGFCVG